MGTGRVSGAVNRCRRYCPWSKADMLELTEDQFQALSEPHPKPPRLVKPRTKQAFVLLGVDEYEVLTADLYDDSPWTREELHAAAQATAERARWDADADDEPR
jgi:alpha-D-ribose 1-methylphosphonate 5-phosphate C-P lyase